MLSLADSPCRLHWLRAYYITGDEAHGSSIFAKITQAEQDGKATFPFTSGSNLYDFIDVDELANMIVAASVQDRINGIINVCTGKPMSLADRVEKFLRDKNYKIRLDYGAFPDRPTTARALGVTRQKSTRFWLWIKRNSNETIRHLFLLRKNGDVDDFITYYLADLHKNLTELVVVCNGKLSAQGRAAFEQFTDTIIVRENKGLDVWAYKTALDFYGWEKLSEYDEIVMTNSTLMGPVRPLQEMFEAMWENQDLDFWGLSLHHGAKSNPFKGKHLYNYLPVHIQSHFIVYRKRFVQNPELQAYWIRCR